LVEVSLGSISDGIGNVTVYPNAVRLSVNGKEAVVVAGIGLTVEEHGTTVLNVDVHSASKGPEKPSLDPLCQLRGVR
jgi:hypothetical protein